MTTGQGAGRPAERPAADAEAAPGSGLSRPAADADAQETAPLTGRIAAAPDDPRQQLEQEIERTREQLGETVQELAARADVKSRARAKAAEVAGRVKSMTVQARKNAAARTGSVRSQVASSTAAASRKAISAGGAGKDQLRNRVAAVGAPVRKATPERVRRAAAKGADGAQESWIPLAIASGLLFAGYLALRQYERR
jgi:hypothetical protein